MQKFNIGDKVMAMSQPHKGKIGTIVDDLDWFIKTCVEVEFKGDPKLAVLHTYEIVPYGKLTEVLYE